MKDKWTILGISYKLEVEVLYTHFLRQPAEKK